MLGVEEFIEDTVADLAERMPGKAIIACSGGVDSMVAATLASRAIGDRLLAVYVDNGLMRKGETEEVESMLHDMGINYRVVDAGAEFFEALEGVTDPERKRKIIGEKFIRVFERNARDFGAEYLVQGTIAPDWIESGDGVRDTIKSHHNVGGLPDDMGMTLVEPLRDLYKDEVRDVARRLGVKASERQPFPGPALAVRCLGEVTPESIAIVREACFIVEDEIRKAAEAGTMEMPWQYFAVLLPSKSVGVQGDRRAYGRTIAVRAVASVDGMTATYARIPLDVLDAISTRITNTMKDSVNRVVYDITNKPPATIEWERSLKTPEGAPPPPRSSSVEDAFADAAADLADVRPRRELELHLPHAAEPQVQLAVDVDDPGGLDLEGLYPVVGQDRDGLLLAREPLDVDGHQALVGEHQPVTPALVRVDDALALDEEPSQEVRVGVVAGLAQLQVLLVLEVDRALNLLLASHATRIPSKPLHPIGERPRGHLAPLTKSLPGGSRDVPRVGRRYRGFKKSSDNLHPGEI